TFDGLPAANVCNERTMLFHQQRRLLIPFLTGVLTGISTVTYVFMNHSAFRSERYGEPLHGIIPEDVRTPYFSTFISFSFVLSTPYLTAAVPLEGRHLLWNKTKFALTHIAKYFGDQYDYFYKADDDTYAFVDNLKRLLTRFDPGTPLLFGQLHMALIPHGYPSGGAGYVMSRTALRLIVNGFVNVTMCRNDEYIANEDVKVGACANALGIPLIDSRDANGQRHFFSESPFKIMASQGMKAGFHFLHSGKPNACCAKHPISFHYIEPQKIYFLDYRVHGNRSFFTE
ncbi:glycoprotein-N-acetylgalactosamine 3-beta-galactosyltransferase, partial [Paragonimus westermani]